MNVFIHPRFQPVYQRSPLVLVDVGARGGPRTHWAPARPHLRFIGFEPDPKEFARLRPQETASNGAERYFNTAVHNAAGAITLHVARDGGLSSIFPPNREFLDTFPESERFDTVQTVTVPTDTLDHVLSTADIADVDFVKADTQGSELYVLQGAAALLERSVLGVEVEVEFAEIYKGQPLFADVDRFLRGFGFALFDLRPVFWKRAAGRALGGPYGQMVWADALYLKQVTPLQELISRLDESDRPGKLLKAVSVALLYGYVDYALELARQAGSVLPPNDQALLVQHLENEGRHRQPLRNVPGRRWLARASHRLWKLLVPRDAAWSVSRAKLGN